MDYQHIYATQAEAYDALVAAEDCERALDATLAEWLGPGDRALEIGVGTGRVTALLCARGARVVGCEPAAAMLEVARRRFADHPVTLHATDCEGMPEQAAEFDLAIAGWVFGHLRSWRALAWREAIGANLDKMIRALKPGGRLVLIETLGTGQTEPRPPSAELAEYYAWLEGERGLVRRELRTDYRFGSVEAAAETVRFFFGETLATRVREQGWTRIPECTGVWTRRF